MSQTSHRLEKQVMKTVQLNYLLHLPEGYEQDSQRKWPLILFLHGAGERGDDIQKVKKHGIPKIADHDPSFPFIAVSPQCPENSFWTVEEDALLALLDEITAVFNVDKKRIYLTGLSMGGFGTWHLASSHPEKFAAIVPICGGGSLPQVKALVNTPVWAFHGAKDDVVKLEESEKMVNALLARSGNVKLTVYPEAKHDSWTETYANPELYEWLLSHSLD
jgi:predicted peptidase